VKESQETVREEINDIKENLEECDEFRDQRKLSTAIAI
jgi:hypothetical protein